ncbi:hypothetical protein NECAME_12610 [Necator americanus]|uniref:Uncharacterized protein n=1 Tax=Necator americanus TaxID=51031 RepID=W2SZ13_NECAM|nr:hypothetical protein NECAME_12610 [Necator americanus]ETN74940.1 hypothetical protein NECAME_12610 [Necator americanus]
MKEVMAKFDEERADKENSPGVLQFTVRNDVIVAYRSITDRHDNRLAVVGVQWRIPYANALFMNWTRSSKQWSDCKKMDCLIITKSGFVLASSTNRSPALLARFDPQLFATLEENGLVTTIELYYLITSFVAGQPSMSGGLCRFQRIKPVERRHAISENEAYDRFMAMYPMCFLRHTNYKMTLNITKQIQLSDMKCARYARIYPLPGTTLTLIRADRACPGYRSKKKYTVQHEMLEGCEKVTYFEKRPPTHYNTSVDPNEEPTQECLVSGSTTANNLPLIQFLIYLLVLKPHI